MEVEYAIEDQGSKLQLTSDYIDSRAVLYGIGGNLVGMVAEEQPSEYQGTTTVNGDFVVLGRILVKGDAGDTIGLIGKLSED